MTPSSTANHRTRPRRSLGFWLAVALLVHVEAALLVGLAVYLFAPRDADLAAQIASQTPPESVEIGTVDDATARRLVADMERERDKAAEEEAKKAEESITAPGQVVELPKPREERRLDQARFAAEFDSVVAKETKKNGRFVAHAQSGRADGKGDVTTPAVPASAASPGRADRANNRRNATPALLAMRTPGPVSSLHAPGAEPGRMASLLPSGQSDETQPAPPEGQRSGDRAASAGSAFRMAPSLGGPATPSGASSLLPTPQQVARAISSGTDDYVKGVDEGEETALNAKKWKFAAFFNRVKQQVCDHWHPNEVYAQHDPTSRIYGQADRFTMLRVALRPDGSLANVELATPSGMDFLDDEAIEAFKQAQPFPNPPRQLIDAGSGLISFGFSFYFGIGGAPRMKVFRYDKL